MLKITRDELRKKSANQLSVLFNELNCGLATLPSASPERAQAMSLLAMITREQAFRGLHP